MTDRRFSPDWISPPGDTISDRLEELGWTHAELAARTGFTTKHVNELLHGRASLTPDAAVRLAPAIGGSVEFWLTREAQYRAALADREAVTALEADADWLAELPVAFMIKQGQVARHRSKGAQVRACLERFGVASVEAWRQHYGGQLAAYRASKANAPSIGAVAAWLRACELRAADIPCAPFDKAGFRAALHELRALTREPDPAEFEPRLVRTCASHGVAVVLEPAPPKCGLHGATRWLTPDKALLGLTLRHKSNDQLWFTLFHEAAHLLLHGKKLVFTEGLDGLEPELEQEADTFAGDLLIPPRELPALRGLRSAAEVEAFADRLGIAPGIVVGRMQHNGLIPYSHLNHLKVRYEWAAEVAGG